MNTVARAHLETAAFTHAGMAGKNNEDRYALAAFRAGKGEPVALAVVADGVGGHHAGEVAAEMAVDTITRAVAASDGQQPLAILGQAIAQASQAIRVFGESSAEVQGLGTTVACAWAAGRRLYTATVGNSRIYLLCQGTLRQLSTDHTWVQQALESGALTPEQARRHPQGSVITRYLGSEKDDAPDFRLRLSPKESAAQTEQNQGLPLEPGDIVFLCSDGLFSLVSGSEITEALGAQPLQQALEHLAARANARGGHDNITAVALRVLPGRTPDRRRLPRWRRGLAFLGAVILLALLLALAVGLFGPSLLPRF